MSTEAAFIDMLRNMATHPAARGLDDDAAVLPVDAGDLVITHDMLAEGVHFLPDTDPADIAWKLIAVNMSDLAAKGAKPLGVILGYTLGENDDAFVAGLKNALDHFDVPLLGGDTIAAPGAPQVLGLTAIGMGTPGGVPSRGGARAGDTLHVTGTIGDAGAGLDLCREGRADPADLVSAYLRPRPRLAEGAKLAPAVSAMMDVSDGLLIDAVRMASASGCAVRIALDAVPLSGAFAGHIGDTRETRLKAATAGDDYALLFALDPAKNSPVTATSIGTFEAGEGLVLTWHGEEIALPDRLGFQH